MRLPRDIRAVVFDKDGVLADSEAINLRSAFEVFREHGHALGPQDEIYTRVWREHGRLLDGAREALEAVRSPHVRVEEIALADLRVDPVAELAGILAG